MRIRYLDWREGTRRLADRLKLLKRLFSILLVQEDGDVDRALEILEAIGKRYDLFDEDLTFEDLKQQLLAEKLIGASPMGFTLTPKGEHFIRTESLNQIFSSLKQGGHGDHRTPLPGKGVERTAETRAYQFGDDTSEIDFVGSYQNALFRSSDDVMLEEGDLRVFESERHVSVATALLVDISHSMVLYGEDRITPAKRVALALVELIRSRYPRDALHVILFGDSAREISVRELTYAGVGPYHTNTQAALELARRILMRKKHTSKQIFMITDGKPSALFVEGKLFVNSIGLDPTIVKKTLDEAAECRRHRIPITTFMLARDVLLVRFVENLTRVNRGRAFFSSLDRLEQTVFVDFLRNRQRRVR
ncbi:MAG TPA: VWA domain-containing protein [Planctomycetota bacterium]|nr:VWA domain-containing protein [Planctomycetota bacterium]